MDLRDAFWIPPAVSSEHSLVCYKKAHIPWWIGQDLEQHLLIHEITGFNNL